MQNNKLIIVDADYFIWCACLPEPQINELGEKVREDGKIVYKEAKTFEQVIESWNNYMINLKSKVNSTNLRCFITLSGSYRKLISPTYKANRKDTDRPEYLQMLQEYLIESKQVMGHKGYEADDLCISCNRLHFDSLVVSNDKDLIFTRGERYNWTKDVFFNTSEEEEIKYLMSAMIVGDSADNVPGLMGRGISFVNKLFNNAELNGFTVKVYYDIVLKEYQKYYNSSQIGFEQFINTYNQLKIKEDLQLSILL